jgi:hypothetical protein
MLLVHFFCHTNDRAPEIDSSAICSPSVEGQRKNWLRAANTSAAEEKDGSRCVSEEHL